MRHGTYYRDERSKVKSDNSRRFTQQIRRLLSSYGTPNLIDYWGTQACAPKSVNLAEITRLNKRKYEAGLNSEPINKSRLIAMMIKLKA